MKFTKEEIETAKTLYDKWASEKYTSPTFKSFLDSLLKPETKKIRVEIEYFKPDGCPDMQISYIKSKLEYFEKDDFVKVTELPEVFTRKDMIEFGEYSKASTNYSCAENFQRFVTFGRKSK